MRPCQIPFFDAPCSDAAGSQIDYSAILRLMRELKLSERWDEMTATPFLAFSNGSQSFQLWFDNPQSLKLKYALVKDLALRGLAMWNADTLDYAGQPHESAEMWKLLSD